MLLGMRQGPFGDPSPVINWDFLQSQSLTSFSRTSNATLFDSTGKLTYAANNLLLRSQEFQTTWVVYGGMQTPTPNAATAPDGTATADLLSMTSSGGIYQTTTNPGFATYVLSCYAKASTNAAQFAVYSDGGINGGAGGIAFDMTTGNLAASIGSAVTGYNSSDAGNGWRRYWIYFTTSSSTSRATIDTILWFRDSSGLSTGVSGYVWGAQLERVTYQTTPSTYNPTTTAPYYGPRYPYAYNGTTWDAQGLLVEAAATNLQTYSNTPSQWTWSNGTLGPNNQTSPDGTVNASTLTATATDAYLRPPQVTPITGGAPYTASVFLKGSAGVTIRFYEIRTLSFVTVTCDGTFQRVALPFVAVVGGDAQLQVGGASSFNSGSVIIYGFQVEAGSTATSYIPNLATGTTTRNADTSLAFSAISLPTGLSFSRASNAMQYDAAGRLTYAPNNLCRQSNSFTTSPWVASNCTPTPGVTDPLGGTSAWTLTATGGPNTAVLYQPIPYGTSVTYVQTFWVRRRTGSGTINWSALAVGVGAAITVTSSWTQVSLAVSKGAGADAYFGIRISTNGDAIDIYAPTFSEVTYETVARPCDQVITTSSAYYGPRYDYDPLTRLPKGLLIEEGRTNGLWYSTNFATGGGSSGLTITQNTSETPSPDGTNSASKVVVTSGNLHYQFGRGVTTTGTAVLTVYVKPSGYNFYLLKTTDSGGRYAVLFNIATGSYVNAYQVGTASGRSYLPPVAVGNGWYRLCVLSPAILGTQIGGFPCPTSTPSLNGDLDLVDVGDGVSGCYQWGAQVESGSFPTSYIPTTSASVARSADVANVTGANFSSYWNASAGTMVGEFAYFGETDPALSYAKVMFEASDGIVTNRFDLRSNTSGGTAKTSYSSTAGDFSTSGGSARGVPMRNALAYAAANWAASVNGGAAVAPTTPSASVPAVDRLTVGGSVGVSANAWVRKFAYYNVRLADAKLQTKSVVGATL